MCEGPAGHLTPGQRSLGLEAGYTKAGKTRQVFSPGVKHTP